MKYKTQYLLLVIIPILLSSCTMPQQDTIKLHSTYTETPVVNQTILQVKSELSFKPGVTRFTYPIGAYKAVKKTDDYVYYLSPYGVFVDPISCSFYDVGGIRLYTDGEIKFVWSTSTISTKKETLNEYQNRIELIK